MLLQRVLTAAVIGVVLIGVVLWLPSQLALLVLIAILLLGAWEWALFPGFERPLSRFLYVATIAAALASVWLLIDGDQVRLQLVLWVSMLWWMVALAWILLAPQAQSRFTAAAGGVLDIVPAGVALAGIYTLPDKGPQLLLYLLLLVWAADVGAFFVGRRLGRLKLAPRVSPNKTWEGVIGGVAGASLIAFAGAWWFDRPVPAFYFLSLGVVLISIAGDLTESMFKRYAGVKDSGRLFPGHGGVLDRFDSIFAAAPAFLLGLFWQSGS